MADGNIDIELELEDSKAISNGKKAGSNIAKGIESGLKNVGKAADSAEKDIEKPLKNAAKSAKSSFSDVGSAAKSSFSDVGDAAKSAASDASSSFKNVPSDAKGAFADVSSDAQSGFSGVADAAQSASSDAASALQTVGSSADSSFDEVEDAARKAGKEVSEEFGTKAVMAGNIAADAIEAVTAKALEFGKSAIDAGTEFDKSMSQVAATMGITTDEIGDLTEFAKEMGAATAFSASQASQALNYMALAGYDAETSMSMLPTVLNLAAAGDMELATASDMVTDAQSALGLSLDETAEMVDKMAKASSKSNTSVEQLGNAFLTVGGTAKNLKGGTTELATALGILADNGIKGSEGGTALRNIILSLSAPTDKAAEAMESLGISAFDVNGNMRPLNETFGDLGRELGKLSQQEQTQALNSIFNKVDLKSVNALLANTTDAFVGIEDALANSGIAWEKYGVSAEEVATEIQYLMEWEGNTAKETADIIAEGYNIDSSDAVAAVEAFTKSVEDNGGRWAELTGYINQADGAAQKMADTQLDNLAGDMTLLESATEGLYISISDKLSPFLRSMAQFATNNVMPALMDIVKNFGDIAPKIIAVASAFAVMKARSVVMTQLTSATGLAARAAQNLGRDFATMTVRQKVAAVATNGFKTALNGLGKAMPLLALTALFEGITLVAGEMRKAQEREEKLEASTKGLEKAASGLTVKIDDETGAIEELGDAAASVDLDELTQQHIDLAKAIGDTNQSAATSEASLSSYGDAIQELAGRSDLSQEQIARLKLAVDGVNESCGTSYEVVQDNAGAYQIMADGAVVAKDSVYDLIEAQKAQIRAEAEAENYKAVYEQMAKDQDAIAEATKNVTQKQEEYNRALENMERSGADAYLDGTAQAAVDAEKALNDAKGALSDIESQAGATQSSLNRLEEQQILTNMAMEDSASAVVKAADANLKLKAGVQGIGVDLVAFTKALESMGFTSEQVSSMSAEDAVKLADAWTSGYDDMKSATEEVIGNIPQALQDMGEDAYNESYGSAQKAGQGFTDGLSSNAQAAIDAALNLVGMTREEFDKLAEEAGISGEEAAIAFANQIAAGRGEAQKAGEADATAASRGMGSKDPTPQGAQMIRKFATAIGNGQSQAERSGKADADAAASGMQSQTGNASTWGSHLGDLFASGIRAAQNAVSSAGEFLAGIVKNILGHTVAKEGPLHEGGKGEYVWGLHLVQNIADGMTSSKAKSAIRTATREVAVELSDGLKAEMAGIEPMAQLQASITQGNSALNMSSMMVGAAPSYTTNNQALNFYGDYYSPDIIAREMRMQQHYGLAGQY